MRTRRIRRAESRACLAERAGVRRCTRRATRQRARWWRSIFLIVSEKAINCSTVGQNLCPRGAVANRQGDIWYAAYGRAVTKKTHVLRRNQGAGVWPWN